MSGGDTGPGSGKSRARIGRITNVTAIFQREFKAYFLSPAAYVVITVFLLPQNWFFLILMNRLSDHSFVGMESPMSLILGANPFVWLLLFATLPAITMKLFADEKRSGTMEMLMTAPVTETQVVLGKYLSALAFYIIMWLPTLAYVAVIRAYGSPDMLKIVSGYMGMILIGAMLLGLGLLASSVTRNQITAYILGMMMCMSALLLSTLLGNLPGVRDIPGAKDVLEYIDVVGHVNMAFSQGIVDTRNIVYCISVLFLCLFVTVQVTESRRWKG